MGHQQDMGDDSVVHRDDDNSEAVRCNACGTVFWGVNEEECDRWMAGHVLDEHYEEAPESVLGQARERLEAVDDE